MIEQVKAAAAVDVLKPASEVPALFRAPASATTGKDDAGNAAVGAADVGSLPRRRRAILAVPSQDDRRGFGE